MLQWRGWLPQSSIDLLLKDGCQRSLRGSNKRTSCWSLQEQRPNVFNSSPDLFFAFLLLLFCFFAVVFLHYIYWITSLWWHALVNSVSSFIYYLLFYLVLVLPAITQLSVFSPTIFSHRAVLSPSYVWMSSGATSMRTTKFHFQVIAP